MSTKAVKAPGKYAGGGSGPLGPDLHAKMSKKIAQLTKVIYQLNTKADDHELEMAGVVDAYEQEIQQMMGDVSAKLKGLRQAAKVEEDSKVIEKAIAEMKAAHDAEKEAALADFAEYKSRTTAAHRAVVVESEEQIAELSRTVARLRKEFKVRLREFEEYKASREAAAAQSQSSSAAEVEELVRKYNVKYNDMLKTRLDAEEALRAQAAKDKTSALAEAQAAADSKLKTLLAEAAAKREEALEQATADAAARVAMAEQDSSAKLATLRKQLIDLENGLAASKDDGAAALRSMRASHQSHVAELQNGYRADKAKAGAALAAAKAKAERLSAALQEAEVEAQRVAAAAEADREAALAAAKAAWATERETLLSNSRAAAASIEARAKTAAETAAATLAAEQATVADLKAQIKGLQDHAAEYNLSQTAAAAAALAAKTAAAEAAETALADSQAAEADLRKRLNLAHAAAKSAEAKAARLAADLAAGDSGRAALQKKNTELAETLKASQAKIVDLEARLDTVTAVTDDARTSADLLREQIDAARRETAAAQAAAAEAASEYQAEIEAHSASLKKVTAAKNKLQAQLDAARADAAQAGSATSSAQVRITELEEALATVQQEVADEKAAAAAAAQEAAAHLAGELERVSGEARAAADAAAASRLSDGLSTVALQEENRRLALKAELEGKIAALEASLADKDRRGAELEATIAKGAKALAAAQEDAEARVEATQREAVAAADALRAKGQAKVEAAQASAAAQGQAALEAAKARHKAEIDAVHAMYKVRAASASAEAEAARRNREESLGQSQTETIARLRAEHAKAVATLRADLQASAEQAASDAAGIVANANEEIMKLKQELGVAKETLKQGHASLVAAKQATTAEKQKAARSLRDLRREMEETTAAALAEAGAKHSAQIESLRNGAAAAEAAWAAKRAELEDEIAESRAAYANRPSRPEDLAENESLRSKLSALAGALKQAREDLKYYKLELQNREENYNEIFGRQPKVGLLSSGSSLGRSSSSKSLKGSPSTTKLPPPWLIAVNKVAAGQ